MKSGCSATPLPTWWTGMAVCIGATASPDNPVCTGPDHSGTMQRKENAMIELTEQQRLALGMEEPPRLLDPQTQETYVLVRADVYERMRAVIDGMTRRAG